MCALFSSTQRLEFQQELPISRTDAWEFFSRPENLALITPDDLGFEVVSDLPGRMYAGMIVSYRIRPLAGLPVNWTTEITQVREPEFFVDEQRSGPYRFWHHQHLFEGIEGGVRMTDLVHYRLPFGLVGHLLMNGLVRTRLNEIFAYRSRKIHELFAP